MPISRKTVAPCTLTSKMRAYPAQIPFHKLSTLVFKTSVNSVFEHLNFDEYYGYTINLISTGYYQQYKVLFALTGFIF